MMTEFYLAGNPRGEQMVNMDILNIENIPEGEPQDFVRLSCTCSH